MTAIKKYRKKILTKAKKYYKNNKDRLREQKKNRYRELSKKVYIYKTERMEETVIVKCRKKENKNEKKI